ncbi:unnamed protein product [Agarophyton chilense]
MFRSTITTAVISRVPKTLRKSLSSPATTTKLQITQRCVQRIKQLQQQRNQHLVLRVQVDGGGCSGFQYGFELESWDQKPDFSSLKHKQDKLIEQDGVCVIVDDVSLAYVSGAKVDYVQEMISSSFCITDNPNSDTSCGCGVSFSPKM